MYREKHWNSEWKRLFSYQEKAAFFWRKKWKADGVYDYMIKSIVRLSFVQVEFSET